MALVPFHSSVDDARATDQEHSPVAGWRSEEIAAIWQHLDQELTLSDTDLQQLTADIVSAHVANNAVAAGDIAGLIKATYAALARLGAPAAAAEDPKEDYTPATTVRKSLADPMRLVSMIDGRSYSSLKRHIASHGLTPATYRERYGLKADYPMVAPGYSETRRKIAGEIGLGRKKAPEATPAPVKRQRKAKSVSEADATA